MERIIQQRSPNCNTYSSQTTDGSHQTTNLGDVLTELFDALITQNIESFYRHFSKQELEVFKYLMFYWRKYSNIQIPILNLCNRFNLSKRRIHYLLKKLLNLGLIVNIKKGHTGKFTKRIMTERGMILWKAISKGFGAVKQLIPRKCADSCADSSGIHTNYISTKVDISQGSFASRNSEIRDPEPEISKEDGIKRMKLLKEMCLNE